MIWLRLLANFINAVSTGAHPAQIAGGFTLGFVMGLVPGWPLHVWILLIATLLLNVNLGMAVAGSFIAVVLAWLFDPLVDALGAWLLEDVALLHSLWTAMFNSPIWMLTRFNNTVVMGATVFGLAGAVPLFFALRYLIIKYRETIVARIRTWRLVALVRGSRAYDWYTRLRRLSALQ